MSDEDYEEYNAKGKAFFEKILAEFEALPINAQKMVAINLAKNAALNWGIEDCKKQGVERTRVVALLYLKLGIELLVDDISKVPAAALAKLKGHPGCGNCPACKAMGITAPN